MINAFIKTQLHWHVRFLYIVFTDFAEEQNMLPYFAEEQFKVTVLIHTFFKNLIGKQKAMKTLWHIRQMEQKKYACTQLHFLDYCIEKEIKHWHSMHFF